jgi:hypothetical protein
MGQTARTAYCVELAVEYLAGEFTRCTFCTLTFKENLTVKRDAQERWLPLKERLRRRYPALMAVGVWQRQKRGAWHLHLVCSDRISIEWLRPAALDCGFGSFTNIKYVDRNSNRMNLHDFSKAQVVAAGDVARYITRYLTRERDPRDKGVRLVEYLGKCRISTQRFSWAGGMSFLWRKGCAAWKEFWGVAPSFDGWENVIQMGWDSLTRLQREQLLETSKKIYEWQHPERFPF